MHSALILFVSMMMSAGDSDFDVSNGQSLLRWLEDGSDKAFMRGVAHGFVQGETATLTLIGEICPPSHVSYGQIDAVVLKWLKDHPKELQRTSAFLVDKALRDAWKCGVKAK
jgi:hypothetical protein